jgi:hypothetical protein
VSTIIALFFGAGLTLSAVAGVAVFATAALAALRSLWASSLDSLENALARSQAFGKEISQPRARWHTP